MTLNAAQVGFGAAVLAGLILAFIGHPGPQEPMPAATSTPASASRPQTFALKSVSVELPTSDITFPGGAAADAINANCLSCHSAGMVLTQPNLAKAAWRPRSTR
jgi:cytochrome c5